MRKNLTAILLLFSNLLCFGQGHRIELLTRSENHEHRPAAASLTGAPEISADGNLILFVSDALNLSTNPAGVRAFNLYMTDRRAKQTILISEGLDALPANNTVEGYQF